MNCFRKMLLAAALVAASWALVPSLVEAQAVDAEEACQGQAPEALAADPLCSEWLAALRAPQIFGAAWTQPEDFLAQGIADVIARRKPSEVWKEKADIKSARDVGPSANWYAMAAGIGTWLGNDKAASDFLTVLREPNDYGQGETTTDDGHALLRWDGLMVGRKAALRDGRRELAEELDREIMQWWALQFLCARSPDDPRQIMFVCAAQRPVFADGNPDRVEYLYQRGLGIAHSDTRVGTRSLAKTADRTFDKQGDFTMHRMADFFLPELRADVQRLRAAYERGSWPEVGKFLTAGSRGSLHFLRFAGGGYVTISERAFGLPGPRWVAMHSAKDLGAAALQFPAPTTPRQPRSGGGRLDLAARLVLADDGIHGKFKAPFPDGELVYHVHLDPTGVHVLTGAPTAGEPPVVTPPPADTPSKPDGKGGPGCGAVLLFPPSAALAASEFVRRRRRRKLAA